MTQLSAGEIILNGSNSPTTVMYCPEGYYGLCQQVIRLGRSHKDLPKLMAVRLSTSILLETISSGKN
jgi:hypothetical protein